MTSLRVKVSPTGRISIPVEMRRAIGLESGGDVVVELADDEIRIRSLDQVLARAQDLTRRALAGKTGVSVDDFIAERRDEARRDDPEQE